jgi:hypothetical protein
MTNPTAGGSRGPEERPESPRTDPIAMFRTAPNCGERNS